MSSFGALRDIPKTAAEETSFGLISFGLARFGLVSFGLGWFVFVWFGLVSFGFVWFRLVSFGFAKYSFVSFRFVSQSTVSRLSLKYLSGKTPVADEKMPILATDRGSKSAREICIKVTASNTLS